MGPFVTSWYSTTNTRTVVDGGKKDPGARGRDVSHRIVLHRRYATGLPNTWRSAVTAANSSQSQQFSFWPGRDSVAPTGSRLYRRLVIGEPRVDHEAGYQRAIQPTASRRYFYILRP